MSPFRWNDWNLEHATQHGVSPEEAEGVVRRARPPFPRQLPDEKFVVWGRGQGGRWLQVVFLYDDDRTAYVIHARELNEKEKRRLRRRRR